MCAILLVSDSLTGKTRAAATALREQVDADLLKIEDAKPRKAILGTLRSIWETITGKKPEIRTRPIDLTAYRLVVFATPARAARPAPPLVSFLDAHSGQLREVAFLCTFGGAGAGSAFQRMAALSGLSPKATVAVADADRKSGKTKA